MTETRRIKLLEAISNRLHPHALAIVVGLTVILSAGVTALWIIQSQVKADLDHCKESFKEYKEVTEKRWTGMVSENNEFIRRVAAVTDESKREVNALRYDFAKTRDSVQALASKFLTPTPKPQ